MAITETRIGLVEFTCPGCDCGVCVSDSMREIAQINGVLHVRVDRRRTQIVVRHEHEDVSVNQLSDIVAARGIGLCEK
jgi:copper chaperone CopZ